MIEWKKRKRKKGRDGTSNPDSLSVRRPVSQPVNRQKVSNQPLKESVVQPDSQRHEEYTNCSHTEDESMGWKEKTRN